MNSKLYVLVRNDLSKSQQAVQAGHAVAEYMKNHPNTEWRNGILVYLRVMCEYDLAYWYDRFHSHQSVVFREEDMDNEMTAVAALGVDELVKDLPLL